MTNACPMAAARAPRPQPEREERPRPRPRVRPVPSDGRRRAAGPGIRWDRLGRIGLLLVFMVILALYVGPIGSYVSTWQEASKRRAAVAELKAENQQLRARRAALQRRSTLVQEARKIGLVAPGERPYVVRNLPKGP